VAPGGPLAVDAQRSAERFRLDVEDAGNRWPAGWVPGVGYVNAIAAATGPTAFLDFAEKYLNTRTAVSAVAVANVRYPAGLLPVLWRWFVTHPPDCRC